MGEILLKQVGNFFQSEGSGFCFQSILKKIKQLEECNKRLARFLTPSIKKYCAVANMTQNRLVIIAANGSIATQIRLQSQSLLQQFMQDPLFKNIREIHCKVSPSITAIKEKSVKKSMLLLSTQHAQIIKEMAETLNDPKLREIMLRIASHKE